MITTQSEINQSNLANPNPFHPSWRRRCFAAWAQHKNPLIKPTSSLPISSIMASQMLCCMISTMSLASCSVASSRSSILARASVSRIRLSSCLCTQKQRCGTFPFPCFANTIQVLATALFKCLRSLRYRTWLCTNTSRCFFNLFLFSC